MIGINILILLMMKSRGTERLAVKQSHTFQKCSQVVCDPGVLFPEWCGSFSHPGAIASGASGRNQVWMKRQNNSNLQGTPPMKAGTLSVSSHPN